jgi:hypothetical protein
MIKGIIIINTFIKAVPLYAVWSDKINWKRDIIIIMVLFLIYAIWLFINSKSRLDEQNEILKNWNTKTMIYFMAPITPGMLYTMT